MRRAAFGAAQSRPFTQGSPLAGALLHLSHRLILGQTPEEVERQRHRDEERQHIADGLGDLHAQKAQRRGQNQEDRDEQQAAAQCGEEAGPAREADALEHHVGADAQGQEEAGHALVDQRREGDGHHLRVRLEHRDQGPGEDDAGRRADAQQHTSPARPVNQKPLRTRE